MRSLSRLFSIIVLLLTAMMAQAQKIPMPTEIAKLMLPEEAINLALSEPLTYQGTFIPYDSHSKIPSCLFKNSKVTLIYHYCRKKEAPAVNITFHNADTTRGNTKIYAESDGRPVSQTHRDDYIQYFWKFYSSPNIPGYNHNMSAEKYNTYYYQLSMSYVYGCYIVEDVMNNGALTVKCAKGYEPQQESWGQGAHEFWRTPTSSWYKLQLKLRQLIAAQSNL